MLVLLSVIKASAFLNFGALSITNNVNRTASAIANTTNNDRLLAIINNVSLAYLTVKDFIAI